MQRTSEERLCRRSAISGSVSGDAAVPCAQDPHHHHHHPAFSPPGAYIDDDSSDYVSIRAMCPRGAVSNYQRFVQYTQANPPLLTLTLTLTLDLTLPLPLP